MAKSIMIDCAPGSVRPQHLMVKMISETKVPFKYKEPAGKLMGEWTWVFDEFSDDEWKVIQKIVGPYLTKCWEEGWLRYAGW